MAGKKQPHSPLQDDSGPQLCHHVFLDEQFTGVEAKASGFMQLATHLLLAMIEFLEDGVQEYSSADISWLTPSTPCSILRPDGVWCAPAHSAPASPISEEERLSYQARFNGPRSGQHSM